MAMTRTARQRRSLDELVRRQRVAQRRGQSALRRGARWSRSVWRPQGTRGAGGAVRPVYAYTSTRPRLTGVDSIDVLHRQRQREDHIVANAARGELAYRSWHVARMVAAEAPSCHSRQQSQGSTPNSQRPTSNSALGSWELEIGISAASAHLGSRERRLSHEIACRNVARRRAAPTSGVLKRLTSMP